MVYQHVYTFTPEHDPQTSTPPNRHVVRKLSPEDRLVAEELKLDRFANIKWLNGGTPELDQEAVDTYVEGVRADRATSTNKAFYPERHAAAARDILALGGCIMDAEVEPGNYNDFSDALCQLAQANLPTMSGDLPAHGQE